MSICAAMFCFYTFQFFYDINYSIYQLSENKCREIFFKKNAGNEFYVLIDRIVEESIQSMRVKNYGIGDFEKLIILFFWMGWVISFILYILV